MKSKILLEAGTNELELLVFRLKDTMYGVNVAKVREIIQREKTVLLPNSPPEVEGSFTLRDEVITLINLGKYLGAEGPETQRGEGLIVVLEFNNIVSGVLVDSVQEIHRAFWNSIDAPPDYFIRLGVPITGTTQIKNQTVLIADVETIISDILGQGILAPTRPTPEGDVPEKKSRILFVDDSVVIRKAVGKILSEAGYVNVTICHDGQHAWDTLESEKANGSSFDLVLSDIEMPRVDGLRLTAMIKNAPDFQNIPVLLFSSLITDDNLKKCASVGADGQVSKSDAGEMLDSIDRILSGKNK